MYPSIYFNLAMKFWNCFDRLKVTSRAEFQEHIKRGYRYVEHFLFLCHIRSKTSLIMIDEERDSVKHLHVYYILCTVHIHVCTSMYMVSNATYKMRPGLSVVVLVTLTGKSRLSFSELTLSFSLYKVCKQWPVYICIYIYI